jgi:hypothetical protein
MNTDYKIVRKFNLTDEWLDNTVVEHHYTSIITAYEQNIKNVFSFNNNYINYDLILISLEPRIYIQIKEDKSISYFKLLRKRYIKKKAEKDIIADYLDQPIVIQKDKDYYYDNQLNKIVIGWHGTYSPPYGMDGYPIINNIWF